MGGTDRVDLLPHALRAAARFPVIPLAPASKTPAIEHWPRRATQDRRTIRRWWAARYDRNVGVCTGSGLLVVDLDVANHGGTVKPRDEVVATGLQEWRRLLDEHGDDAFLDPNGLPRTYTVETPSMGWHVYLRVEESACCRNSQQLLGPRIDTRGIGVVAAVGVSIMARVLIGALSTRCGWPGFPRACVLTPANAARSHGGPR